MCIRCINHDIICIFYFLFDLGGWGQNQSFDKAPMVNLDSGRSGNLLLAVGNQLPIIKIGFWAVFRACNQLHAERNRLLLYGWKIAELKMT